MRPRHHRLIPAAAAGALGALCLLTVIPTSIASASQQPSQRPSQQPVKVIPLRLPLDAVTGHNAGSNIYTIDCVQPGSCTAGGGYHGRRAPFTSMVASEVHGRWQRAVGIKLPANSGSERISAVASVDCAKAGDCTAVGSYDATHQRSLPYVVAESRGHWGRAHDIRLPRTGAHAHASAAELLSVACTGQGTCMAVGGYANPDGGLEPMAVTEHDGRWTRAVDLSLPANATHTNQQDASFESIACPKSGTCSAVGTYVNRSGANAAMAISESSGVWQRATKINLPPGAAARGGDADLSSVSCTGAGSCLAVGSYASQADDRPVMTVTESGGRWSKARTVNALPKDVSTDQASSLSSISCGGAGNCVATGTYFPKGRGSSIWLTHESAGKWASPIPVILPPDGYLNRHSSAQGLAIDCTRSGDCALGGSYTTRSSLLRAVVAEFPVS
jgi:hypothetical protein